MLSLAPLVSATRMISTLLSNFPPSLFLSCQPRRILLFCSSRLPVDGLYVLFFLFSQVLISFHPVSMTSPGDAPPVKPPPSFSPGVPRVASKTRYPDQHDETSPTLDSDLVGSRIDSSPTTPLSAATTEFPIRTASPHARSVRSLTPQLARSTLGSPLDGRFDGLEDVKSLIVRSFSPVVGVYASEDTNDLVRQKGFKGGFWELIRPFGEDVHGKIVIRDSVGSSNGWEDYGVHFVGLGAIQNRVPEASNTGRESSPLVQVEEVLKQQLDSADDPLGGSTAVPTTSSIYKLFLRQLLSSASVSSHETFRHPVACVIAISSRNTAPLESLRQLYADTNNGDKKMPPWVHPEYLRYYVLVHDEDRDDIAESTKLYDQMKRHFGLHCHLLRLRSNQCVVTDDDSVRVPQCEWLSPSEHLLGMGHTGGLANFFDRYILFGLYTNYLFQSLWLTWTPMVFPIFSTPMSCPSKPLSESSWLNR